MRLWKRFSWLGGVRTPLVVHWPSRLSAQGGQVRQQFCHAIDLMPTLLEAIGVDPPEEVDGVAQQRIDGVSLMRTFDDASAPNPRNTQYFELLGSRAIYHEGWKATTNHVGSQLSVERELIEGSHDFDADHWALFHLDEDFSESTDVGDDHPDKRRELEDLWWRRPKLTRCSPSTTASSVVPSRWSRRPTWPDSARCIGAVVAPSPKICCRPSVWVFA